MKPIRFYAIALVIIVLDQITKSAIMKTVMYGESRQAFGRILSLTHTHNTGGAFSLFTGGNSSFILVAAFAVLALVYAYHKYQQKVLSVRAALALALGGAVGNLIDRIRFGFVVDFFDFRGGTDHTLWPIFNVADSAITVGIFVLAGYFLFSKAPVEEKPITNEAK